MDVTYLLIHATIICHLVITSKYGEPLVFRHCATTAEQRLYNYIEHGLYSKDGSRP